MDSFFCLILIAGAVAGGSMAALGVYILGMRMPFIGTCISHAAMAGAVYGVLLGLDPAIGAVAGAILTAFVLAWLRPERIQLETSIGQAVVFSALLGLTFLGVGLIHEGRSEVLSLLWGSLLFVRTATVFWIVSLAVLLAIFLLGFRKPLKSILFSRSIAAAEGLPVGWILFLFLLFSSVVIAVNLKAVGGLLMFSLMTSPAAAAYQIGRGFRSVVTLSLILGVLSAVGGFLLSYYADLPTGACIVLTSSALFALCLLWRILRQRMP